MADYEDEDEMWIETEPEDSDFVAEGEGPPACPAVAMQQKEPRHHTKASEFLLKVFGKEQSVQSHH